MCVCRTSDYQNEGGLYIFRSHLTGGFFHWMKDVQFVCICLGKGWKEMQGLYILLK